MMKTSLLWTCVITALMTITGCATQSNTGFKDTARRQIVAKKTADFAAMPAYMAPMVEREAFIVKPEQNTEKYQHLEQNPVYSVLKTPISTFSVDVDTGAYSNVRRFLNEGRLPPKDAVRAEEMINYFVYQYKTPTDGKPFAVNSSVVDSPWKPEAKVISIGIKGKEMTTDTLPPANLVFLIDVSGSMYGENKLELAKHTLRILTQRLREQDSITLITYADGEKVVLETTKGTKENKDKILKAINQLSAGGSTYGENAIVKAYQAAEKSYIKEGINRILLLTDGDFNVGVTDFETLKNMVAEKRKSGISLSTFGFGTGNYNEQLMEQIADAGDGNYSYIDNKNEAKKVLDRQLSSTLATIAQDVKVQVEFNPATVKEYRLIGYENRLLKEEDFNNDKVDAGDIGAGHSVTALYEIIPAGKQGWLNESRYQQATEIKGNNNEYAHVAIRYKLPNQDQSNLINIPIKAQSVSFDKTSADTQWAITVASFAELLKGGKYAGDLDYQAVKKLAQTNQMPDTYGLKTEFIELVDIADSLSTKKPQ